MTIPLSKRLQFSVLSVIATIGALSSGFSHARALEEVVVTAQKRSGHLQSTALAVTALGGNELSAAGINDLTDLETRVPGFSMGTFNLGQPQLYIRGIGSNEDGAGGDNSVVVFVDEVYIGRAAGSSLDLYDLERVEVLRGPQGTLFGKNVVGGAIHYITRKPEEQFYLKGELGTGNLGDFSAKTAINGALSENIFANASVSYRQRDGYTESIITGDKYNDIDALNGRAKVRFLPNDALDITLGLDFASNDQSGPGHKAIGGLVGQSQEAFNPVAFADNSKNFGGTLGKQDRDVFGLSLHTDLELDSSTLTSITAYRESDYTFADDIAANANFPGLFPLVIINGAEEEADQFSQELRLTSSDDTKLRWIAGLYYLKENIDRSETFIDQVVPGVPAAALPLRGISMQDNETESVAVFGQIDYDLTDKLTLSLGGRYTDESKDIKQSATPDGVFIQQPYAIETDESWSKFTPKATLEYQASDDIFTYFTVSTGFKSGGFQGAAPTLAAAQTPFDEETATNHELGAKMEFFDNTLRLNLALFHIDYEDLQVLEQLPSSAPGVPGPLVTTNAAEATSQGVELEFQWAPAALPGLSLSGNYAYLDTEFDAYAGRPELIGNALRNAPENSYNLVADYRHDLNSGAALSGRLEYRHKDRTFQDVENLLAASIPSYQVVNARLTYSAPNDKWDISAWVNNLNDEEYFIHNFASPTGVGSLAVLAIPAPPRTYGVTFSWHWQ